MKCYKTVNFARSQKYIYIKYIGNVAEGGAGVLLPREPVSQNICMKLLKTDDNDRAHKSDANTLS